MTFNDRGISGFADNPKRLVSATFALLPLWVKRYFLVKVDVVGQDKDLLHAHHCRPRPQPRPLDERTNDEEHIAVQLENRIVKTTMRSTLTPLATVLRESDDKNIER